MQAEDFEKIAANADARAEEYKRLGKDRLVEAAEDSAAAARAAAEVWRRTS